MRLRHGALDLEPETPPLERTAYGFPLPLRARLGRFALDKQPIPAEWALAWVRLSPQVSLRTPAVRCPDEFEAAFRNLYRHRFGDGMVVKPNNTQLALTYQPASGSFSGTTVRLVVADLPDVGVLTAPVDRLKQVAEAATQAIDKYSRFVGCNGDGSSLAALGLLPPKILRKRVRREPPPLVADVASALRPDRRGGRCTTAVGKAGQAHAQGCGRRRGFSGEAGDRDCAGRTTHPHQPFAIGDGRAFPAPFTDPGARTGLADVHSLEQRMRIRGRIILIRNIVVGVGSELF